MKEKLNKALIVIVLLFVTFQSKAQSVQRQSIASSGTYMLVNGILIRQTVGQPYSTIAHYGKEISYRPGFQQPSNFSLKLINSTFSNLSLNVYPNPAAYSVTIESSEVINDALLQAVNMNGKLILNEKVGKLKTHSINCNTWDNGAYFITLYDKQNNKYSSILIINK